MVTYLTSKNWLFTMDSEIHEKLLELGLSDYEARAYLALMRKCAGTMREISKESGVPYQKIYQVCELLEEKGLVKLIHGRPKRVKLVDPEISLKAYRERLVDKIDKSILSITSSWKNNRNKEIDRSIHVRGERAVVKLVKKLVEGSRKLNVIYDKPPEWLVKALEKYRGELTLVTTEPVPTIKGNVKRVPTLSSRFMILDDSLAVTFSEDDGEVEIILDSCKGCLYQVKEHFNLLTSMSE